MKQLTLLFIILLSAFNTYADGVRIAFPNEPHTITYKDICLGGYLYVTAVSPEGYNRMRHVVLIQSYDTSNRPRTCKLSNSD